MTRILGISNPKFIGVRTATEAICTDYTPIPHLTANDIGYYTKEILKQSPDILIVGGWSQGYQELLAEIYKSRRFPVVCISHGGLYHGKLFGDDKYTPQIEDSAKDNHIDFLACVDPRMVRYSQEMRKRLVLFMPHAFSACSMKPQRATCTIGILGLEVFHKNVEGPIKVVNDYVNQHPNCTIATHNGNDKDHISFLGIINDCDILVHLSHLEAYSNVMQEAWSRGIPTIFSPACLGLATSPLFTITEQTMLKHYMVRDNIDPSELWKKIDWICQDLRKHSQTVHSIYSGLSERTAWYNRAIINAVITWYHTNSFDPKLFRLDSMYWDWSSNWVNNILALARS